MGDDRHADGAGGLVSQSQAHAQHGQREKTGPVAMQGPKTHAADDERPAAPEPLPAEPIESGAEQEFLVDRREHTGDQEHPGDDEGRAGPGENRDDILGCVGEAQRFEEKVPAQTHHDEERQDGEQGARGIAQRLGPR